MPQIPDDLMPLADAIAAHTMKRSWWDTQVTRRKLITYRVPGQKGVYVSRAAVEQVTAIRPNVDLDGEGDDQAI